MQNARSPRLAHKAPVMHVVFQFSTRLGISWLDLFFLCLKVDFPRKLGTLEPARASGFFGSSF